MLLQDVDLVRIANSFPRLEELDISYSYRVCEDSGKIIAVTDEGILGLASKLRRLKRINLMYNDLISDKSLVYLSSNCEFLTQVVVGYSRKTKDGVSCIIRSCGHLESLMLCGWRIGALDFGVFSTCSTSLRVLFFGNMDISDKLLYSIAQARLPLKEFTLNFCRNYTFDGILSFIRAYQSLELLVLQGAEYLNKESLKQISPFLLRLKSLKLYSSPELADLAFFTLVESCSSLIYLEMGATNLGTEPNPTIIHTYNSMITSLRLSSNRHLNSDSLKRMLKICPSLDTLDLYYFERAELDLEDIIKSCRKMKKLGLISCPRLTFSDAEFNEWTSELEVLGSKYSGITDEILKMVGKGCPRLLHLDLEECKNVTEEGVRELIRSCKRLMYLNLNACPKVPFDIVHWIVSSRPSLRRLVSPSASHPDDDEQKLFLEQGCMVYEGFDDNEYI